MGLLRLFPRREGRGRVKLLLTNDDGYGAPGLEALFAATEGMGERTVLAPSLEHSCCSHRVTTDEPIRLNRYGGDRFSLDGTPADCVRVALHTLRPDTDWILAGINAGGNMGADVYISGTVAAAREAVLHGWPAIAVSHYHRRGLEFRWDEAAEWVAPLLRELMSRPWEAGMLWNINLPHLDPGSPRPEVVFCPLDPSPLPLSFEEADDEYRYNGVYADRPRRPGTDVDVCFSGSIAVTQLRLF